MVYFSSVFIFKRAFKFLRKILDFDLHAKKSPYSIAQMCKDLEAF